MNPADLKGSDVITGGETAETDTSRINAIGLDVDTEIDVGVVLVVIVGSGDGFECIDISEGFDLIVFKLEPCFSADALVEAGPGVCESDCGLDPVVRGGHLACLTVRVAIDGVLQAFVLVGTHYNWEMSVILILQEPEPIDKGNVVIARVEDERISEVVVGVGEDLPVVSCGQFNGSI